MAALLSLALGSACQSDQFTDSGLYIEEATTGPNELILTLRVGTRLSVSGMRVDTVGKDTVVTMIESGEARRIILAGLSGYRGRIGLKFVDLVIGDTAVWIDGDNVKVHGPNGTLDVELSDNGGEDRFGERDLVVRDGQLASVNTGAEAR